jgi:replicative DNA helicase
MEKRIRRTRTNVPQNESDKVRELLLSHGRLPPQATDLEEVVLGAMMLERDAVNAVIDILHPQVFYKDAHQRIYEAIQSLFNKLQAIDILTVTNELRLNGDLELVGGPYFISQLTNRVVSAANIEFHARIILQKYIQRELIRISSEIIQSAYEETTDVFELLDSAEKNLFNVSETNLRRSFSSMPELVQQAIREIEAARNEEAKVRGVASGYTALDRITQGWQKSDLIILAARPSMGKTAFALNLARNAAIIDRKPVAFFSLEMSSVQLVTRLISTESSIPADKLRSGKLEQHEWTQLVTKIAPLVDAKIFIDDTPQLKIFELRAKCRRLKQQHDIQMVFVDYLQLMVAGEDNRGNREQEISTISRSLKSLAKELDIPVLALSQLSRSVENRPGSKKPILSDLRESGAIEQDADLVIFIYRPEYYGLTVDADNNETKGLAVINIAKHRNGKLGDVNLRFVSQFARFEDPAEASVYQNPIDLKPNLDFGGNGTLIMPSRMNDEMDHEDNDDDNPF